MLLLLEIICFISSALYIIILIQYIIERIQGNSSVYDKETIIKISILLYISLGIGIWIHYGYPYAFIWVVWIIDFFKQSKALTY